MPALLIRHRVTDYVAWKRTFDEQGSIRWSSGCRGGQVFRSTADPCEIVILLNWDDPLRATLYTQSDEFRDFLKQAGVRDDPDMWVIERAAEVAS